jgi:hypothetical protein
MPFVVQVKPPGPQSADVAQGCCQPATHWPLGWQVEAVLPVQTVAAPVTQCRFGPQSPSHPQFPSMGSHVPLLHTKPRGQSDWTLQQVAWTGPATISAPPATARNTNRRFTS